MANIANQRIAVLATDGFEQAELIEPVNALKQVSAQVVVVAPQSGQIQGMVHQEKGEKVTVDHDLASVSADQFDALVLPGGVANPDTLRTNAQAVAFVKHFVDAGKPIAAICHGPWTLIEADGVRDRHVTSWPSLRTDLKNAGATWEDKSVIVDGNLVTSRKPDDLPDFCRAFIALLGEQPTAKAA